MEKHSINPYLARFAHYLYTNLLYPIEEYQKENLKEKSYIFAPNHTNNLDGYIIWSLLAKDYDIDTFMYKEFWDYFPHIAKILPLFNVYPITRDELHPQEILTELKKLKDENHSLVIFPQGRHVDLELMKELYEYHLKTIPLGAFFISMQSKKKIVPIYMEPQKIMQKNTVIYGTPLDPKDFISKNDKRKNKENIIKFANAWLVEINRLYQLSLKLTNRPQHPYKIKKNYTDASGLDYRGLNDPNIIKYHLTEVKQLIAIFEKTNIPNINELGELTDIPKETLKIIEEVKNIYEKRLIKHN